MKLPATFRIALFLVLAVPAALAVGHQFSQGDPIDQINPGPLGMADFGKIVSGEFNGDFVKDVYVSDAGEPKLVVWPESHKNAHSIGTVVNDFDVFHNFTTGKDALITVDWYGLRIWVYDPANDNFGTPTVVADENSSWGNALLVREAEVDGSNGKDIVGVAANGNDVLVMLNNGNGTFSAGTGYTNTYDIYDMVVLNWRETNDTAGTDEIATFTPSNWQVREPSGGQLLKTTAWSGSTIRGCALNWGSTTQCLALIARSGGADWLATYGVGNFADGPYSLGDINVVGMTSGYVNNDSRSDLFLSIQAEKKVYLYLQNSTTPLFPTSTPTKIGYGSSSFDYQHQEAGLVADDFDGDGWTDLLVPAQGHLTGMITAYGTLVLKQLGYGTPGDLKVGVSGVYYNTTVNPHDLMYALTAPNTAMSLAGCTAKIRLDVWQTSDLQGETTAQAVKSAVQNLPDSEEGSTFSFPLPTNYDPHAGGSYETYSLVCRQVLENNTTHAIVDEGPALVYMWVPQRHYATFSAATDVTNATVTISWDTDDPPPGGGGGTGPTVPGPGDNITPKR